MDLTYSHPTPLHILRANTSDDATDLVAIGGDHSVDVLLVVCLFLLSFYLLTHHLYQADTGCRSIASFHIGSRITAIAWSSISVSPSSTDNWSIEYVLTLFWSSSNLTPYPRLAAAADDFGLYLLNKKPDTEETVFPFGGGLSGHHGKVNDMTFCGGWGEDSTRYVATASGIYPVLSTTTSPL